MGETITGKVDNISTESITTKDGRQIPKFVITMNGRTLSKIGNVPKGLVVGDMVTVDTEQNGQFTNVADIKKNGVSIIPPKFGGGGFGGGNIKGSLVLAAVEIAVHNAKIVNKELGSGDMAEIKAIFEELQKIAQ